MVDSDKDDKINALSQFDFNSGEVCTQDHKKNKSVLRAPIGLFSSKLTDASNNPEFPPFLIPIALPPAITATILSDCT